MGSYPFEAHDSTYPCRLSLVATDHLDALANTPVHYLHFMLTALGYQPRTTSANFLLIRLIRTMPPTVRYGVDESRRLPLTLHVTCLHRTPLNIHGSFACLDYPCGRQLSTCLSLGCPSL